MLTKEPWAYEGGIGQLAANALRLRHRMIPFLYSCNRRTATEGLALCEPLYYQYPECGESYRYPNEYRFGQQFLVAPVTEHSRRNGLSETPVWLPEGVWTDFFTGDIYRVGKGGREFVAIRPTDSIPVFAEAGAVMVCSDDPGNACGNPHALETTVWNGNGGFRLYEDREDGAECLTVVEAFYDAQTGTQTVTIRTEGDQSVIPTDRRLSLRFPNIVCHHPADELLAPQTGDVTVTVERNGQKAAFEADTYAEATVTLTEYDPTATYTVRITVPAVDVLTEKKREVIAKLQKTQAPFSVRRKHRPPAGTDSAFRPRRAGKETPVRIPLWERKRIKVKKCGKDALACAFPVHKSPPACGSSTGKGGVVSVSVFERVVSDRFPFGIANR